MLSGLEILWYYSMISGLEILWLEIIQQHICMKMDFVSSTIVGLSKHMNHNFFSDQCVQKFLCRHPTKCSKSFFIEYNPRSIRAFQHLHEDQPIMEQTSSDDS